MLNGIHRPRISQATTEVAPSGGTLRHRRCRIVRGADSDDDVEYWGPLVRVFDPVESKKNFILQWTHSNVIWKVARVPGQSSRTLRLMCRPVFTVPRKDPTFGGFHTFPWVWILVDQDHQTTTENVGHMPAASMVGCSVPRDDEALENCFIGERVRCS